mgnify:CR=1 FL=1
MTKKRRSPTKQTDGAEPWYAEGLNFACTQCGNCCGKQPGWVWVSAEEVRRISEHLGRTDGWLGRDALRREGFDYSLVEQANYDCVFLRREEGGRSWCSIHSHRPQQCRTWPFWSSNLSSPAAWQRASRGCPGIKLEPEPGAADHHSLVQLRFALGSRAPVCADEPWVVGPEDDAAGE